MRRLNLTLKLTCAVLTVIGLASFVAPSRGVEPAESASKVALVAPSKSAIPIDQYFVGAASCTAVSCHGGSPDKGVLGSEHSLWLQRDKHADAYNVLFNDVSLRMAKSLKLEKPAHESMLCLNCHGPVADAPHPTSLSAAAAHVALDGVSCEACHGPASNWLASHVRNDWKSKTVDQKAAVGFRDTNDLWTRAKVCADCHVGSPGRDVNHDLYAAGHPRLFFELSAFHALMPNHWDREADRARAVGQKFVKGAKIEKSPLEAKLWSIGQIASAEAQLDLLMHRAERSKTTDAVVPEKYPSATALAGWPELAETACYACHHDLASPSWRQARGYSARKPGAYPWGTWLFPLVPHASTLAGVELKANDGPLGLLTLEMSKPNPDREQVIKTAKALQMRLTGIGQELNRRPLTDSEVTTLASKIATDGVSLSGQSWDEATQVYLSLVSLSRAHQELTGRAVQRLPVQSLAELRDVLKFEDNYDSPQTHPPKPPVNIEEKLKQIKATFEAAGR